MAIKGMNEANKIATVTPTADQKRSTSPTEKHLRAEISSAMAYTAVQKPTYMAVLSTAFQMPNDQRNTMVSGLHANLSLRNHTSPVALIPPIEPSSSNPEEGSDIYRHITGQKLRKPDIFVVFSAQKIAACEEDFSPTCWENHPRRAHALSCASCSFLEFLSHLLHNKRDSLASLTNQLISSAQLAFLMGFPKAYSVANFQHIRDKFLYLVSSFPPQFSVSGQQLLESLCSVAAFLAEICVNTTSGVW